MNNVVPLQLTRLVGSGHPMFIVAEMGQNHNGKLDIAIRILNEAKRANVDAVKLQTLTAEKLVSKKTPTYGELDPSLPPLQWQMYKQVELSKEDHKKLFEYAQKIDMTIFSTPFDEDNVDFLEELGVSMFKIASGDLTDIPFLKYVAKKHKPMVISTGMGTTEEVKEAVKAVEEEGNQQIILLHCTSSYPCNPEHVNLSVVQTLMKDFPYPIGLSDHTLDNTAAIVLAGMGGALLEKHFTCDKKMKGIDHWLSADGDQMKSLVEQVRLVERMLGDGFKRPNSAEQEALQLARRSIVSRTDIKKGSKITHAMISIRRPGTGILPKHFVKVLRRVAKIDIPSETPITWDMLK